MAKGQLKGSLMLILTAIIWGAAFVAQSAAMDNVGPLTFYASRSVLGAVILLPVIYFMDKAKKNDKEHQAHIKDKRTLLTGGTLCGILLCTASLFQQYGLAARDEFGNFITDPGKAGFITAMYIIIVPILGLFIGKKVPLKIWFCLAMAVVGLSCLCLKSGQGFTVSRGDILVIVCAFTFSFHILTVDKFSPITDGVRLSFVQFVVCAIVSGILMFIFETPDINSIKAAAVPILYAGIGSSGIAYTLQIIAQKYASPTSCSLIMSTESVFALLCQIIIMGIMPSSREIAGCVLMFAAIIISQLPGKSKQ